MSGRLERFAPLTGVVFIIAVVVLLFLSDELPDADDPRHEVVSYWTENDDKEIAVTIIGAWATVFFVWFAASLRSALRLAEGGTGRLSSISFAGALILAAGLLVGLSIEFAAADSVGDVPAEVTHTLSVLSAEFFFPIAAGFLLFLVASGLAIGRTRALPVWLGWAAIVLGVVSLTPIGFAGFIGGLIWILIASILLFRRGERPVAGTREPAPAGAPPGPAA
jgi:hypothetical protein